MITAAQLRAARALIGIDQRELAQRCALSVPTIQRMEASDGVIRGNVDSLMKLIDALAASFLVVVNLGGAAASLFAVGYGRHEHAPQRVLPFYPAYLAAMNLVVMADDAFSFLVSWEFMSLTSWALVISNHELRENMRAGFVYLLMASFGTLTLLLAFGLLAGPDGNYAFDAIRAAQPTGTLAALIFILALTGAGSKAGLVPLHAWLPLAHPAAPSHVSALMSGVMTKVAVYG